MKNKERKRERERARGKEKGARGSRRVKGGKFGMGGISMGQDWGIGEGGNDKQTNTQTRKRK